MESASKLPGREERLVLRELLVEPKMDFSRGARRLAATRDYDVLAPAWLASPRLRFAADGASSPPKASLRRRSASGDGNI
jgi:hypothetical protein